jgi:phosphate transport system substrate-binding protein
VNGQGPITLYSRNTLSGTYEYFRETALYGGDYKPEIKQQSGSEAVVQAVAADKFAIGSGQPLDQLRAEFVKYVMSKDDQEQTERGGFFPITNEIRESDMNKLGISPGS